MQVHFAGHLTARDAKRTLPHPFVVPPGCTAVEIDLRYAPAGAFGIANNITLTLFDPRGFRGAGHREAPHHQVCITPSQATPGYLPGPIPAGEWIAEVDTHMVMPGEPVRYTLDVCATDGPAEPDGPPSRRPQAGVLAPGVRRAAWAATRASAGSGPRWYRGDLHTHTHHSDAAGFSVSDLLDAAQEAGLDFVFVTDHNTNAGLAELDAATPAAPKDDTFLAAGGIELTTFYGHALCLGAREWIDWRVRPGTGAMQRIAGEAEAADQLFVIAHPGSPGDPACTGCAWRFGDMMPGNARFIEVWNGPWAGDSNNEAALALWYDWLNQGLRLVATAGSDAHGAAGLGLEGHAPPGFNLVHAEALTQPALFRALRAGHVVLSAGPRVTVEARAAGQRAMAGDTVYTPADFTARWCDCPEDAAVRVLANGRCLLEASAHVTGSIDWTMSPEDANWVLVEIRDREEALLALTNPIFL